MERAKEDKGGVDAIIKLTRDVQEAMEKIAQEYNVSI
jgi:hypothetical protein